MKNPASIRTRIRRLAAAQVIVGASLLGQITMGMDLNEEIGPTGVDGIPSAWDSESVNSLNGNVHLTIPLFGAPTGAGFGMSLALHYDSTAWNGYDAAWPTWPPNRDLIGAGRVGFGWRLNLPRVLRVRSSEGHPTTETYSFEGPDGASHRLHRKNCNSELEWYTQDGSGVRAIKGETYWVVWEDDGTKYILGQFASFNNMVPEGSVCHPTPPCYTARRYHSSWYPTSIESAVRKTDASQSPIHTITFTWGYENVRGARLDRISDDLGREITFTYHDVWTADGLWWWTGAVESITIPAPAADPEGTIARQLTYRFVQDLWMAEDPIAAGICRLPCSVVPEKFVMTLRAIEVDDGAANSPSYTLDYHPNGLLKDLILPGGAKRSYEYVKYDYWRAYYDPDYDSTSGQFTYYHGYGVFIRRVQVDGRTWSWSYYRSSGESCTEDAPENCANHPIVVEVIGPQDSGDPTIEGSTTKYIYRATPSSGGTPNPLDGTLSSVQVYAGYTAGRVLLRTTAYEYDFTAPPNVSCHPDELAAHDADNVRVTRVETVFEDDGKVPHDKRLIENTGWTMLTYNSGRFQEVKEYGPDGTTLYKSARRSYVVKQNPNGGSIVRPSSVQVLTAGGTVLSETDYEHNIYGQLTRIRQVFTPQITPAVTDQTNDVVTTYAYDASGDLDIISKFIVGRAGTFTESWDWSAGAPTSRRFGGLAWEALRVSRDPATGLPLKAWDPWGSGSSYSYDLLGRVVGVSPLPGSGEPPVSIEYDTDVVAQKTTITTKVGDPVAQTSIQAVTVLDGLGRVKHEKGLKYNDLGVDEWVRRTHTRDGLGNAVTISEWGPDQDNPPTPTPVTTFERFGMYGTVEAWDPLLRVRRIVKSDGSVVTQDYQGLATTTTVSGIQGGSVGAPTSINATTVKTRDIFGRVVKVQPPPGGAVIDNIYDELGRLVDSRATDDPAAPDKTMQTRSRRYDTLGRLLMISEPERGKVWFGPHDGDTVLPEGYDAAGNLVLYQDAGGFAANPPYHYELSYDVAGRLQWVEMVTEEASPRRSRIAEHAYDLPDSGNGSGSHLGRLGAMISYDDQGDVLARTDYFYQEQAFGRLNRLVTQFGGPGTPYDWGGSGSARTTYYGYDALGEVRSITYPTTGAEGGFDSTVLTIDRKRGLVNRIGSNRGYEMVASALYNDAGGLKQWVAGNSAKTRVVPDALMAARVKEIEVLNQDAAQLWFSGTYGYDGAGNVATIDAGPGKKDVYIYDEVGRLKEALVPGTSGDGTYYTEYFTYDPFGNLKASSRSVNGGMPDGPVYRIDLPTNRILGLVGSTSDWSYREDGALTHDDGFDYGYDHAGRLGQIQVTGTDVGRYGYDASGLRVFRRENHGKEVFYFRDSAGNVLSQFSRPTGTTITPRWDRDFVYFGSMRVSMIEKPLPAAVSWKKTESTATGISLTWYMNPESDIFGYLVYRRGPGEAAFTPLFADGTSGITTTGTTHIDSQVVSGSSYVYKLMAVDNAGNQGAESVERIITFDDTVAPGPPLNLAATPGNAIVSLSWSPPSSPPPDLAGYYLYRKKSGSYGSPLNGVPITSTNYIDLAVKNGTTYYYIVKAVDTAGLLSAQSNEASATPSALQRTHREEENEDPGAALALAEGIDAGDDAGRAPYRLIGQSGGVSILFLHSDHLGSVRMVTTTGGGVVSNHKYLPFGEEVQPMRSTNPFRFAGYERDSESGKDYVKARYYSGAMARWLSPDPLGAGYPYVANNPLRFYDPSGLLKCPPGPIDPENPCVENPITVEGEEYGVPLEPTGHENDEIIDLYCPTCLWVVPDSGGAGGTPKVSPRTPCEKTGWAPHGMGVLLGGNVDAGIGLLGVTGTASAGLGIFHDSGTGLSGGGFASGGVAAYALGTWAGIPAQRGQPLALGLFGGAGGGIFFTNARSARQMGGPFDTLSFNIGTGPRLSIQFSLDPVGKIWTLAINPPQWGGGAVAAFSKVTTVAATTTSGCE